MTRTVYVTQDGASLRRRGQSIDVYRRGKRVESIPSHDLAQLVLVGNILITPAALDVLVERGIDVVILSHRGRFRARIGGGVSRQVKLRLAQAQALAGGGETAVALARSIVAGKLANGRVLLQRAARRHGRTDPLHRAIVALKAAIVRVSSAATVSEARGCEGSGTAAYFRGFGELIRAPGLSFDGRNRRPPMDPINALLSFGYTLLANAVEAAVEVVGLDPYVGALHEPLTGRPSLVCDLVEEMRAPAVDAVVLAVVNRQMVTAADFEDNGEGEPVTMGRTAVRTLIEAFEHRMRSPVHYEPTGGKLSYRGVIEQQARQLARYVLGIEPAYTPYTVR